MEKKQITGLVLDEHKLPVIGANVVEKGTTNGTVTDLDGKFTLAVQDNAVLLVSYIGYITQEIPVKATASLILRYRKILKVWMKSWLSDMARRKK